MPTCSGLIGRHFKSKIQVQNLMLLLREDFCVFHWIMNFDCYQVTNTRANRFNLWGSKLFILALGLMIYTFTIFTLLSSFRF